MTTSTEGILCYGFIINEGVDLPWNTENYNGNFDSWYYTEVVPFKKPFEMNSDTPPPLRKLYFNLYYNFKQENPVPFKLVNYCSWDYPMFILAVVKEEATKGNPTIINPLELLEYS